MQPLIPRGLQRRATNEWTTREWRYEIRLLARTGQATMLGWRNAFCVDDSSIPDWQEEEAVLSCSRDRENSTAEWPRGRSGRHVRPAEEASGVEAGRRAHQALAGSWRTAERHRAQF